MSAPSISEARFNPLPSLAANAGLIIELTRRDVLGRYRGSALGLLWSLFNPLFMLAIYTFAFGTLFKSRWPGHSDSQSHFAIVLFAGLLIFNFFSECISRAPTLILDNANYVKKVVFPLEILPPVAVLSALFHFAVGLSVWCLAYLVLEGHLNGTLILLPFAVLPLVLFTVGNCWFLASLGVYARDVRQIVGVFTSALIFLAPIFYPLEVVPERFRLFIMLNPITHYVEMARQVMIDGGWPNAGYWLAVNLASACYAMLCFGWFQMTRRGFADVI
ncbi:ABC transporter permease [Derxia gummosa]|uniref:Transport permease protein n=1 Tax=Derxia gummosa DSM 723 TaxID=1121388 RepID=A0A8B6X8A1_9BURK|nr:ABC transporter permease [Derxia gummosa]